MISHVQPISVDDDDDSFLCVFISVSLLLSKNVNRLESCSGPRSFN